MRLKWFSIMLFFIFSSPSFAVEKDYKICNVGGFFSGTNDKFLSGLAAHIAQKKHILDDPICSALWRNASRIGEKLSETRRVKEQAEEEITHQAAAFSEKVYEAVSAGIKF
jgi:hypothetical protein